jgi:myo-inositol-1(or 4)-monophosphatase
LPATEAPDLALLIDAARSAGALARTHYRAGVTAWDKPNAAGPVSEADLAVNRLLHAELRGARPDYGWLSEESTDDPARLSTARQFVVDPIDGTRAFLQKSPDWAHALAVIEDGAVISAVVYLPEHDLMFAAARGQGATLNGAPIRVTTATALADAKVLSAKPNFEPRYWRQGDVPPVSRHFRSSLAYRLCLVAEGRFDAMLTLRPTWEWDVAAGTLIVTEAGGIVTDRKGTLPRYNNRHPQIDGMLAAGSIHAALQLRLA